MTEPLSHNTIPLVTRQMLVRDLPCFSTLSFEENTALATLFTEKTYHAGDIIVHEDDLVDQVYIIAEGQAEVSRKVVRKRKLSKKIKIINIPIAVLNRGEAIGLNEVGFFSETGKRTATVTAINDMRLLCLDLKILHQFLQHYPSVKTEMRTAAESILRVQLIKQSLPFSRLSHERLQWLAKHIELQSVKANTILFKQGDAGDRCYLIQQGEVEISVKEDDQKHHLITLKSPALFGEATLITGTHRNATAYTKTDCELLELRYEYLTELLESEKNLADMFMTLMVDRSRPLRSEGIEEHHRKTVDRQEIIILKNPANGNYFKLSTEGWYIWQNLNGYLTLQEITMELAREHNMFIPDVVAGLISKLARAGFIQNVEVSDSTQLAQQPFWVRSMLKMQNILQARVAFGHVNPWLTALYNKLGYLFFTKAGVTILLILAMLGLATFIDVTPEIKIFFATVHFTWILFLLLIPFTMITVALHELGHALATKHYGFAVNYMGVGWFWFSPIAFTDTSDMWLSTRGPRIVVNLAGIYVDLVMAGISVFLIFVTANIYIQCFLWLFAFYTYVSAFRMLSPLQDLDGYYVLLDIFDRTQLRRSSILWLVKDFPRVFKKPRLLLNYKPEICFWLACIIYLIAITLLTLFIQGFVFHMIGITSSNPFISLAIPFFVVIFSSLSIIAEIKSQKE